MIIEGRKIIADEGMVLDFKEPHYALDKDGVRTQVHLYVQFLNLGKMDSPDNYKDVYPPLKEEQEEE